MFDNYLGLPVQKSEITLAVGSLGFLPQGNRNRFENCKRKLTGSVHTK